MTKTIFSKKVALELRKLGFNIIKTEPNPNYPQYDAYIFEDTPELQEAFDTLMKSWN